MIRFRMKLRYTQQSYKISKPYRIPFVKWCLSNNHTLIAEMYADPSNFPELFPKRQQTRFCNDKRDYYRNIYLQTDHWKELRQRKITHQPNCENCKSPANLDVHHLRYKNLYDVEPDDLKVLCRKCHTMEHDPKQMFEYYRQCVRSS
jgi:hypothetical protein